MAHKTPEEAAELRLEIGRSLRAARLKAGHATLLPVEELTGIHRTNLTHFERGNRLPSAGAILTLVRKAGYDPRQIFTRPLEQRASYKAQIAAETAEQPIT